MNPWLSLAQGIDIDRVSMHPSAKRSRKRRTRLQMADKGVSTVAELRTAQVLRDNSKPTRWNQPVGQGFVFRTMAAQQEGQE